MPLLKDGLVIVAVGIQFPTDQRITSVGRDMVCLLAKAEVQHLVDDSSTGVISIRGALARIRTILSGRDLRYPNPSDAPH